MAASGSPAHTNRLIKEKSPYLLQHAHNPVDWYPWGSEAFEKAGRENKPVFLSIGYSTCHWCHVMERESFEDEEVAALLNEHFVSVKVDREERPDVDHIYMNVCQALTGSGGWPLTVIMTPDKMPFFAGTYFPKHSRYGRPGMMDLLAQIPLQWQEDRERIVDIGDKVAEAVRPQFESESQGDLDTEILHKAYRSFRRSFDSIYGGFGEAPKFPTPHNLAFLLRYHRWTGENDALKMVEKTLDSMHNGGVYDHLGFGFARYSVDNRWLVPHFEKMLYDNALLALVYLEACQATGKERYARVAREIFHYVVRDMTSPEGGFYSAEDADSEGEEGLFYVWTPEEIKEVLGSDTGERFCRWYGVTDKGNFEGRSILNRVMAEKRPADTGMSPDAWAEELNEARRKLFTVREKRVHPHKDDKVLTSWSGLMIAALAGGFRILQEPAYLEHAVLASEFIWSKLRTDTGRLLARYRNGDAAFPGYIDDYAFLTWAMIELYQADQQPVWLERALELQDQQNRLFRDEDKGGYFFYGNDAEALIARPKEVYDGATPSGNSVSALNLLRLARITNREEYSVLAQSMFRAFSGNVAAHPAGHTHFLMAYMFAVHPGKEVVVVADRDRETVRKELGPLNLTFSPDTVYLYRLRGKEYDRLAAIAPFIRDMVPIDDRTTFYVCKDFACRPPTTELSEVRQVLES